MARRSFQRTDSTTISGPTGSVGAPGVSGYPATAKKITMLCIDDVGFFKKGEFYDVQLFDTYIVSKDGLSHVSIKEIQEKCIWGDKLRDYKLQEILDGTV